jgi:hypothetical protein
MWMTRWVTPWGNEGYNAGWIIRLRGRAVKMDSSATPLNFVTRITTKDTEDTEEKPCRFQDLTSAVGRPAGLKGALRP